MHAPAVLPPEPRPPARFYREPVGGKTETRDKSASERVFAMHKIWLGAKRRIKREIQLRFRALLLKGQSELGNENFTGGGNEGVRGDLGGRSRVIETAMGAEKRLKTEEIRKCRGFESRGGEEGCASVPIRREGQQTVCKPDCLLKGVMS